MYCNKSISKVKVLVSIRDVNEARMLRERERGQRCENKNETKIIFRERVREQHYENETSETE